MRSKAMGPTALVDNPACIDSALVSPWAHEATNQNQQRVRKSLFALGLLAALLASCSGGTTLGGARTYYESLDLSSPEHAVTTFTDAFSRNDFVTVWLVFSPIAESVVGQDINLLQYGQVLDTAAVPDFQDAFLSEVFPPLDEWEFRTEWYLFDQMMLFADRHDAFLIDLTGPVTVTGHTVADDHTDVATTVAGVEGTVTFRMTLSPSGRWRVQQVIVSDGDTTSIAWPIGPQ